MGENVWADVNRAFEVLHAQSHENMNTLGTGKETVTTSLSVPVLWSSALTVVMC